MLAKGTMTSRRLLNVLLASLLVAGVLWVLLDVMELWALGGWAVRDWLDRDQRRETQAPVLLDHTMRALVTYHQTRGRFPADDYPYHSAAENLYYHLVVDLGLGYDKGKFVGAARAGLFATRAPSGGGRWVLVDPWGEPVQFRPPPRSRSGALPDVWSAGRDGQVDTADDIASWKLPDLVSRWMKVLALDRQAQGTAAP